MPEADLDAEYAEVARDEQREGEALKWADPLGPNLVKLQSGEVLHANGKVRGKGRPL